MGLFPILYFLKQDVKEKNNENTCETNYGSSIYDNGMRH